MIQVQNLEKSYGDLKAVDGVSFQVARGEAFGLLGPNGAGKSTTISIMVGVLDADSGSVVIDGDKKSSHASSRRLIGVAPQSLSLYEEFSGNENLKFFGELYGLKGSKLKDRVNWSLEFAGLTEQAKKRVKTYSGGMKRRLNLACALVHNPQIILLDEPTVGVDPQSRNHIFDSIEKLKSQGRTIIYTTHYMEEAQRLCDRVAIMDHGKLLALGTIGQLIEQYGGNSVVTAELRKIPEFTSGLPGRLEGTSLRIESTKPMDDIATLTSTGLTFESLHIDQPDLETVFLSLTGRSLRD